VRFEDWGYLDRMEARVNESIRKINEACAEATRDSAAGWSALTAPYTTTMLAYAGAYRTLSQGSIDSPAAIAALSTYWSRVRTTLDANAGLAYGNNQAVHLFRIANLILINRAQRSTGQRLVFGNLQQSIRDQLAATSARALSEDVQDINGTNEEQTIAARLVLHAAGVSGERLSRSRPVPERGADLYRGPQQQPPERPLAVRPPPKPGEPTRQDRSAPARPAIRRRLAQCHHQPEPITSIG
jgi:hypothetical protein